MPTLTPSLNMNAESTRQRLTGLFVQSEVLKCHSYLMDALLKSEDPALSAYSYDSIQNLYPDPSSWPYTDCLSYIDERWDRPDLEPMPGDSCPDCSSHQLATNAQGGIICPSSSCGFTSSDEDTNEESNHEALMGCIRELGEPQEIYEWWLVTSWLASKLDEQGEPLLTDDESHWWGRTCTGQAICLDYNIQALARLRYPEDWPTK